MWSTRCFVHFIVLSMGMVAIDRTLAAEPEKKRPAPPLLSKDRETDLEPILDPMEPTPELLQVFPRVVPEAGVIAVEQFWIAHRLGSTPRSSMILVGLFNHGNRPLALEVAGTQILLPPGKNVTVSASREFTWREGQSPLRTVQVPTELVGVELVFPK